MTEPLSPAPAPPPLPGPAQTWRHRLGEVRHDLRNPLSEILGFAEMLLEESREQNVAGLESGLETIRQLANRILADVSHALNPDTLRRGPEPLTVFKHSAQELAATIATEATALAQHCAESGHAALADDLRRIGGSALRLQHMAPTAVDALISLSQETGVSTTPVVDPSAPAAEPARDAVPAELPADTGVILVADDQEANRSLLARRLGKRGYTVVLAENGVEALARLRAQHFDLVLLDIVMPEMDGMEVLRRAKADSELAHIPVLMLSALDELDSVVRCIELGAEDYLPKPFPSAILHARVRACLEGKRMSDRLRKYTGWLFGKNLFSHALAAPAALVLSRQERTLLFADIRGFTQWSERHTPEQAVTMLNRYFETAERLWADSSIIKTEYTGDEIMGVFPSAADAVRVAEALRVELGKLLVEFDLGIGIGVHTGQVIEGLVGGAEVKAYRFVGDTVNTAKRICTEAQRGQVLLSTAAADQVRQIASFGPSFEVPMKGKADLSLLHPLLRFA